MVEIKDKTPVEKTATKPKLCKQTARRGIPLDPGKRNLDRKTLRELKRNENIEEPDDFGKSVVLRNDYEVDLSKPSYEEWLKDQNLFDASSRKEDVKHDSDIIIEIDTTNGKICKKEESSDDTVVSTASVTTGYSNSEVCKYEESLGDTVVSTAIVTTGYSNTEVGKKDETVSSDTVNYTLDDSSQESSLFSYSEEDIAKHYANLATSVITCFSAEFKMEEQFKHLNTILDLLAQDKDEIIKRKKHKRSCEEKAEKEHWERTFGGSKKVDSVEKTVKECELLEGKEKEEEEQKVKAKAAEHKKKEEEEEKVKAKVAECKKKKE